MVFISDHKGMRKKTTKTRTRDAEQAIRVKRTAELCNVEPRQVYRVIKGEQHNEEVFRTYMLLSEGENLLLQAVKEQLAIHEQSQSMAISA